MPVPSLLPLPKQDVPIAEPASRPTKPFFDWLVRLQQFLTFHFGRFQFDPPSADGSVRLAGGLATQFGIGNIDGDGLWIWSENEQLWKWAGCGAGLLINVGSCTIDGVPGQNAAANTLYYVFAYLANPSDRIFSVELSTAGIAPFDSSTGRFMVVKFGDRTKRFIGMVQRNGAGIIWAAAGTPGVTLDHVASYFHRQLLTSQIKVHGSTASATWVIVDNTKYISTLIWGDGADFQAVAAGSVSCSVAGTVVEIGVSRNQVLPPQDNVQVYCAVANEPYPWCVNVSGGSVGYGVYRIDVCMKTGAGTATILGATEGDGTVQGANLTMHYLH